MQEYEKELGSHRRLCYSCCWNEHHFFDIHVEKSLRLLCLSPSPWQAMKNNRRQVLQDFFWKDFVTSSSPSLLWKPSTVGEQQEHLQQLRYHSCCFQNDKCRPTVTVKNGRPQLAGYFFIKASMLTCSFLYFVLMCLLISWVHYHCNLWNLMHWAIVCRRYNLVFTSDVTQNQEEKQHKQSLLLLVILEKSEGMLCS